jgi:hypothetical protein
MNAPPGSLGSRNADLSQKGEKGAREPEIGPVPKRDVLLTRVRAARKRLSPLPSALLR